MSSDLLDRDLDHMNHFPPQKKESILHAIMERTPLDEKICNGIYCYENTIAKLRVHGYRLIDLAPSEGAFTAVWYRKSTTWLGLRTKEHVAMLTWECNGDEYGDEQQTTLHTWEI